VRSIRGIGLKNRAFALPVGSGSPQFRAAAFIGQDDIILSIDMLGL
jgi:hypothetical protein